MFKRHASSNRKLICRGAYAIAFAFPFISFFGETKASKIVSSENQFFVQNKQSKRLQFSHQLNPYKLNLNFDDFLISEGENQKDENTVVEEKRVLISEILIEGLEDHPDKERLEVIAYDAMLIRPGSKVTSEEVKKDLDRIYSTGWFSGAKIRVEVSDTGYGISEIDQQRIFERFYRVEDSVHTEVGTGLGLSIVKGIVDKHGSEIRMASEPNTGTTFWFELPLEESDADELLLKSARKNWELENDKTLIK